jgi:cytochrome b561
MNIIELLILVAVISGGHFLGIALESRLGLTGWFAGCILGIGISLLLIMLLRLFIKHVYPDEKRNE